MSVPILNPLNTTKNGQPCGNFAPLVISSNSAINYGTSTTTGQDSKVWMNYEMLKRVRASSTGDITDTTPTAAQFISYMSEQGLSTDGSWFEVVLMNDNTSASAWILAAGTGVTFDGDTVIDAQETVRCRIRRTSSTAVTMHLLHKGHSTNLVEQTTVTVDSTAGNLTITAAMIVGGILRRDPNGSARTDTTDTAAALVAALPNAAVGDTIHFYLINTADAAEAITLAGGTGVTVTNAGQTIAQNEAAHLIFRFTNVTASSEAATLDIIGA